MAFPACYFTPFDPFRAFLPIRHCLVLALSLVLFSCKKDVPTKQNYRTAEHLLLGNPSNATANTNARANYLVEREPYALAYNADKGIANWVSWHLDATWLGTAERQDNFRPDEALPMGWYRATPSHYTNSGFDRGHLCPSGDRTGSQSDNQATFFMTNIIPQASDNNQGPWQELEAYCRTLVEQGNELYIIAGGLGEGGTGKNGLANALADGKIQVPAFTWKVILVLESGENDLSRINTSTRLITVLMPNRQGVRQKSWGTYRISGDELEMKTQYDFISNVPAAVQATIESKVDEINVQ